MSKKPTVDPCHVIMTALEKGDRWEASCHCGFWVRGRKRDCEAAANGHRMQAAELTDS